VSQPCCMPTACPLHVVHRSRPVRRLPTMPLPFLPFQQHQGVQDAHADD
jgi:hypothetical protein